MEWIFLHLVNILAQLALMNRSLPLVPYTSVVGDLYSAQVLVWKTNFDTVDYTEGVLGV